MKVLLAGNTGYVTEEFVEEAFPECQVMVLGNKNAKDSPEKGTHFQTISQDGTGIWRYFSDIRI